MVKHPNHVLGKEQIYRWAKKQGWQPQMEVYLKSIAQRPDILIERDGQPMALEFQCSPLSVQRLRERNAGYHRLGIGVFWLLGPPYRRHLQAGMICQFTQLLHGSPQLAFWNINRQTIEFNRNYYRPTLTGKVSGKSDLIMKQVRNLQRHMRYRDLWWRELVNQAYMTGHQLSACPLVTHPTTPHWPLLKYGELYWRLRVILKLTKLQGQLFWNDCQWYQWLIQQGEWLPTPCLSIQSRERLIQQIIDHFTSELVLAGIMVRDGHHLIFGRQPDWFKDDTSKMQKLLCLTE